MTPSIRDFAHAATTQRKALAVVVELARATPEEGPLTPSLDVSATCEAADTASVSALAVGLDSERFNTSDSEVAEVAARSSMPLVARDLFLSPEQIYHARILGADAVLLQAAVLEAASIQALIEVAASTHMSAPVEIRSVAELHSALAAGARMLVIPAFQGAELSLALPQALLASVPRSVPVVVRGPFQHVEELATLRGRADAIWVCGPAMRATHLAAFLGPLVEAAENG